jgi:hypothetical protein
VRPADDAGRCFLQAGDARQLKIHNSKMRIQNFRGDV